MSTTTTTERRALEETSNLTRLSRARSCLGRLKQLSTRTVRKFCISMLMLLLRLPELIVGFLRVATLLASAQQLTASNRPSSSEYRSVCRYISQNKPLIPEELEYIQHKEDLVTLRPGRDHAWLDRSIERVLRLQPFSFINVSTRALLSVQQSVGGRAGLAGS
jgi:hypothetical protein